MHSFERQASAQTLAQGLAEYYDANPPLAKGRGMSIAAQEFFRCHDAAHVVFGCGNTLHDEVVVKIASLFGTTAGVRILKGYRLLESREIYEKLSVLDVLRSIGQSAFLIPSTIVRCVWQRRRWPWESFDQYLHVPLRDIRKEYGIRVAHDRVSDGGAQRCESSKHES
jgi:hypothetical protein